MELRENVRFVIAVANRSTKTWFNQTPKYRSASENSETVTWGKPELAMRGSHRASPVPLEPKRGVDGPLGSNAHKEQVRKKQANTEDAGQA